MPGLPNLILVKKMNKGMLETVAGLIVIIIAISFVYFSLSKVSFDSKGKVIFAEFGDVGGIKIGDDVKISGITIGEVTDNKLDQESYLAKTRLNIIEDIILPEDTIARISSSSLLGGQYVELIPGVSDNTLNTGDTIYNTRDAVSLTDLLGQAVFTANQ